MCLPNWHLADTYLSYQSVRVACCVIAAEDSAVVARARRQLNGDCSVLHGPSLTEQSGRVRGPAVHSAHMPGIAEPKPPDTSSRYE